jgi:predicted glycoside hydrolase/deacetylase ChbG (UPF0249 family)
MPLPRLLTNGIVTKKFFTALFLIISATIALAQQRTIQERLGYNQDTKLLIIHADDIGVSHSENMATIYAMEKGSVNSGSIMVPCPWFAEIAAYASSHPQADFGLHLTLTSEWDHYKWGPVTDKSAVPGLVTPHGYFNDNNESVHKNASPQEVEKELRNQIERAKQFGIDPTHFDSHMFCGVTDPKFLSIMLKLGREYKVPVLLNPEAIKTWLNFDITGQLTDKDIVASNLFMAFPPDFEKGMDTFYTKVFSSLEPGLNVILLHASYDNEEARGVMGEHSAYGAAWRQADFDFFTSDKCKRLITGENIKLITWREIRDKLLR